VTRVNLAECSERIKLTEEYSRSVTVLSVRLEVLKGTPREQNAAGWQAAGAARVESQKAWAALERHLAMHQCLDMYNPKPIRVDPDRSSRILEQAAAAALDIILVANDDRRYISVNQAAAELLGLPQSEILGRRIEEFFSVPGVERVKEAWEEFIADGIQRGLCELKGMGRRRRFEYRSKANFAPGLHLSVLREVYADGESEPLGNQR
jgi:PAS domain S-box-containing protein